MVKQMTGAEILALPMEPNDAKAETIKAYLGNLLRGVWVKEETFSGKRPFGNSGWKHEVFTTLAKASAIEADYDDEGGLAGYDEVAGEEAILLAIDALLT